MILYSAPYDEDNALPDSATVDYGDAWGAAGTPAMPVAWAHRGYTQEGAEWEISHDFADIEVDQELSAVLTIPSGQSVFLRSNLAQFELDALPLGVGQGAVTVTAPGASTKGEVLYELTGEISDVLYSWGMDFRKNDDAQPLRIVMWRGKPVGSASMTFGVADQNPRIPIEIRGYPDTSTVPSRLLTVQEVLPATGS
jgi:hypothetical protein